MCLVISAKEKRKVAARNIKCYKVLKQDMRSFYQHFYYELGKTYKTNLRREYNNNIHEVSCGFHTFKYIRGARWEKKYNGGKQKIFEAVIPKGSLYYEGTFCKFGSCASNQLKIIKEVK